MRISRSDFSNSSNPHHPTLLNPEAKHDWKRPERLMRALGSTVYRQLAAAFNPLAKPELPLAAGYKTNELKFPDSEVVVKEIQKQLK